ncbi:MAG: hypothetical protein Q8Q31_05720 [Nanoarchaeota archaeon]|nr:hypothetical protein [Nanoarchaeota archaeon]
MNLKKVIVVPKVSVFDYSKSQFKLTEEALFAKWRDEGMTERDIENVMRAHENNRKAVDTMKSIFGEDNIIHRDSLNKDLVRESDLVISLGGDDHFQYVSHFVDSQLIMGVNSDPISSEGNMLYFHAGEVAGFIENLKSEHFRVEEWTRLEAQIISGKNTLNVVLASSQYAILTEDPEEMVRYRLQLNGKSEIQRGSGLIVATGVGSTGWYKGASKYAGRNCKFPKTERIAKLILREPFDKEDTSGITTYKMYNSTLLEGDELTLTYLSHGLGRLSTDCQVKYDLIRGNQVKIRISPLNLRVIARQEEVAK